MVTAVTTLSKKGDPVFRSGAYVCVPCGHIRYFAAGERFTECIACLAGTEFGPEGYREHEREFWQLLG